MMKQLPERVCIDIPGGVFCTGGFLEKLLRWSRDGLLSPIMGSCGRLE
jgi:hypothetical protein